jgi:hypothetical protein
MKKLSVVLLALLLGANSLKAQTETVATTPKKLQQLYISAGFGPNTTSNNRYNGFGETLNASITTTLNSNRVFRLGYIHAGLTGFLAGNGYFTYLKGGLDRTIYPCHKLNSVYFSAGKRKKINSMLQVQAFGGLSFNQFTRPTDSWYEAMDAGAYISTRFTMESHKLPGVIVQGEAMFLPTQFAGLTLGAYYQYVPGISNGGLTLSLNLGRLRSNPNSELL